MFNLEFCSMDVIATGEGSAISQSVSVAASCTGDRHRNESSTNQTVFCITKEKHPHRTPADQKDEC